MQAWSDFCSKSASVKSAFLGRVTTYWLILVCWAKPDSHSFTDKTRRGLMWWLRCSEHLWIGAIACQLFDCSNVLLNSCTKMTTQHSHPECLLFVLMQNTAGVLLRHVPNPLSLVLNHPDTLSSSVNKQCGFICLYKCWSLTILCSWVFPPCLPDLSRAEGEEKCLCDSFFFSLIVK